MLRILDRIAEAIAIISFAVSSAFVFINVLNRYLVLTLLRDWAKVAARLASSSLSDQQARRASHLHDSTGSAAMANRCWMA